MTSNDIWKIVISIPIVIGVITAVLSIPTIFVTTTAHSQAMEKQEIKLVQTLDKFQTSIDIKFNEFLFDSLTSRYYECKAQLRSSVSEEDKKDLKIECEDIKKERERLRRK